MNRVAEQGEEKYPEAQGIKSIDVHARIVPLNEAEDRYKEIMPRIPVIHLDVMF